MESQGTQASLRRSVHSRAADFLHHSGLLAARRYLRTRLLGKDQICVLGFHRILSPEEFTASDSLPGMMMKQSTFSRLLEYAASRFRMMGLADLEGAGQRLSSPGCLITFDDGWKDNYTRAFPCLMEYRVPAIIFLTTGFVGGNGRFWVERLVAAWKDSSYRETMLARARSLLNNGVAPLSFDDIIERLKCMPSTQRKQLLERLLPGGVKGNHSCTPDEMLNWDDVLKMSSAGIDFGCHTVTHPLLAYEDDGTIEQELLQSKEALEARLGRKVRTFAYPNGNWDSRVRQRVQESGYEYAFTTQGGWHRPGRDPYTIRRILLHEGNVTGQDGQFSPARFNLTLARSG